MTEFGVYRKQRCVFSPHDRNDGVIAEGKSRHNEDERQALLGDSRRRSTSPAPALEPSKISHGVAIDTPPPPQGVTRLRILIMCQSSPFGFSSQLPTHRSSCSFIPKPPNPIKNPSDIIFTYSKKLKFQTRLFGGSYLFSETGQFFFWKILRFFGPGFMGFLWEMWKFVKI